MLQLASTNLDKEILLSQSQNHQSIENPTGVPLKLEKH